MLSSTFGVADATETMAPATTRSNLSEASTCPLTVSESDPRLPGSEIGKLSPLGIGSWRLTGCQAENRLSPAEDLGAFILRQCHGDGGAGLGIGGQNLENGRGQRHHLRRVARPAHEAPLSLRSPDARGCRGTPGRPGTI